MNASTGLVVVVPDAIIQFNFHHSCVYNDLSLL